MIQGRRYRLGERDRLKVPADKLRSVAFLVDEGIPRATALLVGVTEDDVIMPYVVTARHCVEATAGRDFYIRLNVEESHDDLLTKDQDWWTHDSADVAAVVFGGNPEVHYNLHLVPLDHFIGDDHGIDAASVWADHAVPSGMKAAAFVGEYNWQKQEYVAKDRVHVGIGDTVFFVGLLYEQPGEAKNLPIVRFGQVSRMPEEPLIMPRAGETFVELTAYLVECHSWGGSSGSPVYWYHPMTRMIPGPKIDGTTVYVPDQAWTMRLLGLVSGHWDIKQKAETEGDIVGTIRTAINSGIAVVTPADAIRELLMREDVVTERKRLTKEYQEAQKRRRAITPDTPAAPSQAAEESEYQRFEDLTRQVVNVPKKEKDEKPRESS